MKKRLPGFTCAVLLSIGFLLINNVSGTAVPVTAPPASQALGDLENHHKELKFSFPTTQSQTFTLPKTNVPVRIEASTSNVAVSFNGLTTNLGPLVISTVAAYDTATGLGNITGNSTNKCPDLIMCETLTGYSVASPMAELGTLYFSLRIDRNTGTMAVSIRTTRNDIVITTSQVNCRVSMWY